MKNLKSQLMIVIFLILSFSVIEGANWGKWTFFDKHEGVSFFYRVKTLKSGNSKFQWKVTNHNAYKVLATIKDKRYYLSNGKVDNRGSEGWYVKPQKSYTFVSDHACDGRVSRIEINMVVERQ